MAAAYGFNPLVKGLYNAMVKNLYLENLKKRDRVR